MRAFFDTNIVIYAQEAGAKGNQARNLMQQGGVVSTQVLNECTNVLRKKLNRSWDEIDAVLEDIEIALGPAQPLTRDPNRLARLLSRASGQPVAWVDVAGGEENSVRQGRMCVAVEKFLGEHLGKTKP